MKKTLSIFKVCFFIEIIIGLGFIMFGFFIEPSVRFISKTLMIGYVPALVSLFISLKLAIATGKGSRLSEELNIVGHIFNAFKLLILLAFLISILYLIISLMRIGTIESRKILVFYGTMLVCITWILASGFNFFAYIKIAKANKKAAPDNLYDFW